MESGNLEGGRNYADRLIAAHPDSALGPQLLGDIARLQKKPAKAAQYYAKAYELQPTAQRAGLTYQMRKQSGDDEGAVAVLQDWLKAHPEDASVQLMLANEFQVSGRVPEAVEAYARVTELRPDNYVAWNNLAWMYHEAGDSRALQYAVKARELAPKKPEVLDTYGWIELREGDPAKGLKALQDAVAFGPHIPSIQYHLAVALEKNDQPELARKTLARLLKSGKDFPEKDAAQQMLSRLSGG